MTTGEATVKRAEWIAGLIFWIVVATIATVVWLRSDKAEIFLDVSGRETLAVQGMVLFKGKPVSDGTVHIAVHGANSKRYLGGEVVAVDNQGQFKTAALQTVDDDDSKKTLRITASFSGQLQTGERAIDVSGQERVYLNFTPPWGALGYAILGGVIFLLLLLIFLFTGSMTRPKGRLLFGTMYLMTFLSLAVPIGLTFWISNNQYMQDVMKLSPIGLIHGKAAGASGEQWLINIGRAMPVNLASDANAAKGAANTAVSQEPLVANFSVITSQQTADTPLPAANAIGAHVARDVGGLTVPFYVVMLAMFGAGINMTRKVPEIQRRYDLAVFPEVKRPSFWTSPLHATGLLNGKSFDPSHDQIVSAFGIREELIRNYMYLLSAPFLGIAVYYLLQVLATEVNQPVLVLMSFATGLTSELIISSIITFADDTLETLRSRNAQVKVRAKQSRVAATRRMAPPKKVAIVAARRLGATEAGSPSGEVSTP